MIDGKREAQEENHHQRSAPTESLNLKTKIEPQMDADSRR
jgi:hypothetical protein